MPYYRALISMPINAENDEDALQQAGAYADSLRWPNGGAVGGHLERLTEGPAGGGLETMRLVMEDDGFIGQLL